MRSLHDGGRANLLSLLIASLKYQYKRGPCNASVVTAVCGGT